MPARHEILVALRVTDEASYARYRSAMTPLLEARGGFFRVDYRVSEVVKGEDANRVFVMSFPDRAARDAFFADPGYLAARAEHFEPAVAGGGILAAYDAPEQA